MSDTTTELGLHEFGFSTEQVHSGYLGEAGHGARITPTSARNTSGLRWQV